MGAEIIDLAAVRARRRRRRVILVRAARSRSPIEAFFAAQLAAASAFTVLALQTLRLAAELGTVPWPGGIDDPEV